ncbi:gastrokine-1 [Microcaecilia unicolor]|uniref:Gastrokine-1-like n=1 Tax=Microcaecilia unicolor TaxID=1415580 RepID=A0A6P7XXN7_9AMPH|nr:gastrokine-1-like [Microcaecilia unicolor]
MQAFVVYTALLGVLLTIIVADDNINISNQGNVGSDVHQTVNINNHDNVANINNYNGWDSWNTVCDYNKGLFAARLFSKTSCVVTRMNPAVVPSLAQLSKMAGEKKSFSESTSPLKARYTVTQLQVKNVAQYGEHINALCRGIPTFYAQEIKNPKCGGCRANIVTILGISLCF